MHRQGGLGMEMEVAEALSLHAPPAQHSAQASELSGYTNARDTCEAARQTWMLLHHRLLPYRTQAKVLAVCILVLHVICIDLPPSDLLPVNHLLSLPLLAWLGSTSAECFALWTVHSHLLLGSWQTLQQSGLIKDLI